MLRSAKHLSFLGMEFITSTAVALASGFIVSYQGQQTAASDFIVSYQGQQIALHGMWLVFEKSYCATKMVTGLPYLILRYAFTMVDSRQEATVLASVSRLLKSLLITM